MSDLFVRPGNGHRPSLFAANSTMSDWNPPPPQLAASRVRRAHQGKNIWTGEVLQGEDAVHWLRLWAGLPQNPMKTTGDEESPPDTWGLSAVKVVYGSDDAVVYLRADGKLVALTRTVKEEKVKKKKRVVKETFVEVQLVSIVDDSPPSYPLALIFGRSYLSPGTAKEETLVA